MIHGVYQLGILQKDSVYRRQKFRDNNICRLCLIFTLFSLTSPRPSCQPDSMKKLLSVLLIILSCTASAEVTWLNVTGYSARPQWGINKNQSVTILGGMGGLDANCNKNNSTTCNTCSSTLTEVCNTVRIYPTLPFTVFFSSSDKVGVPRITAVNPQSATTDKSLPQQTPSVQITTGQGQNVSVTTTWGEICGAFPASVVDANANCTFNGTHTFKLGIDANSDGNLFSDVDDIITFTVTIVSPDDSFDDPASPSNPKGLYNFSLFPGDQKAYIENVQIASANNRPIAKVHFYSVGGVGADYSQITAADITGTISVINNSLAKDSIDGLPNGEQRFFKARSEDDAGNIGLLMELGDADCPRATITDANGIGRCRAVTPSAVGGLFKDNCFIATAAYGSKFEPHVATLRLFRDRYLMPYAIGKAFVRMYYKISPSIADWIAESGERRAVTRWALAPVVVSVRAFMAAPLLCMFGVAVAAVLLIALSVRRFKTQTARLRG